MDGFIKELFWYVILPVVVCIILIIIISALMIRSVAMNKD